MTEQSVPYKCIFCDGELQPSPTLDFWLQVGPGTGIHYRCIDHLAGILAAIRKSEE